ncbi:MAG: DUF167 domain-containing protein [Brevinemataceae bacterium]
MPFVLELSVVPNSSCDKFVVESSGVKLKITKPPIEGRANKYIIAFLAKNFACSKSSIVLKSGGKSKKKIFIFNSLDETEGKKILDKLLN